MTRYKIILAFCLSTLTGCASVNTYHRIEATPISVQPDDDEAVPQGVAEQAMTSESFPLFDKATYNKFKAAIKIKDRAKAISEIREVVCDGDRPRVAPQLTVRLVIPKPAPGEAVDQAAKRTQEFINLTRLYLKQWWLQEGSNPSKLKDHSNPEFSEYQSKILNTNFERRWTGNVTALIPFLESSDRKEIEQHYQSIQATPSIPRLQLPRAEWFPSDHYLSLDFPKDHATVLTVKDADFIVATWSPALKTEVEKNLQLRPDVNFLGGIQSFSFRHNAHYVVSENSWRLADGTVAHPMSRSVIDDLATLRIAFVWHIPKEDLARLFGAKSSLELKYFGYDYDTGRFSAAEAVQYDDLIWEKMLANQTAISEASEDQGTTYSVKPSFAAFCKWAVPLTSVVTQ